MTDEFSMQWDVSEIIRDATKRLADQTEAALRQAVAAELRRQGWTVIAPADSQVSSDDEREALAMRDAVDYAEEYEHAAIRVRRAFLRGLDARRTVQGDRVTRAIEALSWRPEHDGSDPARVQDDYMRRAQSADTALAILTGQDEGTF